jgi:hypothetical protein
VNSATSSPIAITHRARRQGLEPRDLPVRNAVESVYRTPRSSRDPAPNCENARGAVHRGPSASALVCELGADRAQRLGQPCGSGGWCSADSSASWRRGRTTAGTGSANSGLERAWWPSAAVPELADLVAEVDVSAPVQSAVTVEPTTGAPGSAVGRLRGDRGRHRAPQIDRRRGRCCFRRPTALPVSGPVSLVGPSHERIILGR